MSHALVVLLVLACWSAAAADWPQWRGPQGNSTAQADPPIEWDQERNIVWRAPMPSWSGSTPIVVGERVFVLSPSKGEGPVPASAEPRQLFRSRGERDPGGDELLLLCLHPDTVLHCAGLLLKISC